MTDEDREEIKTLQKHVDKAREQLKELQQQEKMIRYQIGSLLSHSFVMQAAILEIEKRNAVADSGT